MHSNSLEIVYLFSDVNKNVFRTQKSRSEYERITNAQKEIGHRVD